MKPRHAAALALVGRYLMVPPRTGTTVDKNAARDRWEIRAYFDSVARCHQRQEIEHQDAYDLYTHPEIELPTGLNDAVAQQSLKAICVNTGGWGLKGN